MKTDILSTAVSIAALSSCVSAVVTIPFEKNPEAPLIRKRLNPRATITEPLQNNVTGGSYMAKVTIGGQAISLAIDTGSSDVWTIAKTADLCNSAALQAKYKGGGCNSVYDSTKSSNYKVASKGTFNISYADGSGAKGDYMSDTLGIGGANIKALQMGLAYNITLPTGILGIGYSVNEASNNPRTQKSRFTYPSIIDQMVSQSLINTAAYSLYLDSLRDTTGSIIFGGMDTDKFIGNLFELPVVPSQYPNGASIYAELAVKMTVFGLTDGSGTTSNVTSSLFNIPAVLDSGTTITYLPLTPVAKLYTLLNAVDDSANSGEVFIDCNLRTSSQIINYGFGATAGLADLTIAVPITELIFDLSASQIARYAPPNLPFTKVCAFGIQSLGDEGPFILGDTFLRSAYVVYDLKNNKVAMAQTNFNSNKVNVVEFQADQTGIPLVSGVASGSPGVTNTATGLVGQKTNAGATVTVTSTAGSNPTGTSSKSAAASVVPPFDLRRLAVLGVSGVFALLGGAWLLE